MLDAAKIRPLQQGSNAYRVRPAPAADTPQTVGSVNTADAVAAGSRR